MTVVCDASVFIALSRIGHLWLLHRYAGRVAIPRAVYEDLVVKGAGKPGADEIRNVDWIDIREVVDQKKANQLHAVLQLVESEAIVLAKELQADLLILDEEKGRELAEGEGLHVVGILALVVHAKEKGWIAASKPLLDALRSHGFFISQALYRDLLQRAGEDVSS